MVKHQGKGSPPRPRTGHSVTRSHLAVASGPVSISHCPLDGEVLCAASAGGRGASRPPTPWTGQGRTERKPLWAARGPSQTSDPPSGASKLGLPHGCYKYHCAKMQQAQSHKTNPHLKTGEECGPSLSECILLEWEPLHCSLWVSLRRVLTRSRRMKRLVIHLASN